MRVAYTIEQCWHEVPGGTAVAGMELARALAARGDVEVRGVAARHASPPREPWAPPVRVAHLPLPRSLLYESWHYLRWPPAERATGAVDVVHATTMAIPPRGNAPLVVTVHDLAFLHYPEHFTRHGLRFFRRGLKLARADADLVLCSSEAVRRDCVAAGFDDARLRLVPLGVAAQPADEAGVARVRSTYSLPERFVLWTGTIEPRKNLPRLLDAFRMLDDDVSLVLAGPQGWNENLDALLGDARARVHVVGFVPRADLEALYAAADAFCFPSLLEGFGFPVLEAMAQGTPVVTSRGTSTAELAGDAGILIDPLDIGSIADGLRAVLGDPERAHRLADEGRRRAAEFTWERTAARTAACYAEVAEVET